MTRRSEFLARQAALVEESVVEVGGDAVRLYFAGYAPGAAVLLLTGPGRGVRADTALLLPMLARRHRVAALELGDLVDPWRDGPAAVSAALDALGAAEAVVVGHSLGAAVALASADDPRVTALALVAGWLRPTERLIAVARLWAGHPEARRDLARVLAVRSPADDGASPWNDDDATAALVAAAARADAAGPASRLRLPALVVGCSADTVVGVEGAEALLGAIDDARYAVVESGHAVLAERPAELLAVLEHFLADPRRDPAGSVLPRMRV